MTLVLPNDLVNHTPADAAPVQQNYAVIEQYINANLIHRDGSVGMQAPLLLAGDPTQPLHAATKAYVDAVLPVGIMLPFAGNVAPAGKWALANGASLLRSAYPELYAVLGTRYGGSETPDSFLLPNMRGRVPIGRDDRDTGFDARFATTGLTGGSFVVPVPQHLHGMPHTHTIAHTHEHPHVHGITHDHAQFNTVADGGHGHVATTARRASGPGGTESVMPAGTTGAADTSTQSVVISAAPDHVHAVNIPVYNGNSGQPNDATTGGASNGASGPSSAPNTANAGTAGAELVPPFTTIAYIVRIS